MWPYSLFLTIFHFSFLPSCLWLKNTIQPLHCIAFHHICWPFFPSLSCYCCLKFLIYHSFIFLVFIIQSCSATFYKNRTISHFIPFASVETNFPSHSHLSLFLFTMLFSVPSVPCSDLLALPCILCTRSIQSTHAKIFNGLFLAKSQNLHSVFISVAWQLPSILPPFSFLEILPFPDDSIFSCFSSKLFAHSLFVHRIPSLIPQTKPYFYSVITWSTPQSHLPLFW